VCACVCVCVDKIKDQVLELHSQNDVCKFYSRVFILLYKLHVTFAQECTACCDFQYCNEQVPTNETDAFLLSAITVSATCRTTPSLLRDVIVICCVVIATVIGPLGVVT